jgi:hypothetical protein
MDKVRQSAGVKKKQDDRKADLNAPALWPLIRQVNVRCNAGALSSGAILVDLPGMLYAFPTKFISHISFIRCC